jgi:autotransporter-associated beta strand protein
MSDSNWKRSATAAGALAIAMATRGVFAATATVTLNSTPIGVTPRYMGYNMGHYMPGSNTTAWSNYTGMNAYRFWAAPGDYEPTDDRSPFGDGVTTLAQFDSRKIALRADTHVNPIPNASNPSAYINWPYFNINFDDTQSGRNKATLNYALSELQKSGVDVVMQITRSNAAAYEVNDWAGKWEQWQHYYSMAYYAAKNYDVQRYQMYNEPDHDDITTSEWVLRLQLASDAVKSAIEDVNSITGKKLSWSIYAPVPAGTTSTIDTFGKAALNANRTDYAGRPIAYDNFDTYDVHRYNSLGSSFASDQSDVFDPKVPAYNASGQNLPVTYTEFNRYNSGTFSTLSQSPDTPQTAAEYGGIFPGAMSEDVKGMYAFKFSDTVWNSSTTGLDEKQKTGQFHVSNVGTYNIMGSTRTSETMRLAIKAFKGERLRLSQAVTADSTYDSAFTVDQSRSSYYYYSVNRNSTQSRTVTVNLSGLNIPTGGVISYQEVSTDSFGAAHASQFMTVPAPSGGVQTVSFTQPLSSTWLLTIPKVTQTLVNIPATEDAQVSHATPTTNFGLLTSAKVDRSAATTADDATYIKFNLLDNPQAGVGRAFLHVTGANSADTEPVHVYGILNNAWTESGINWSNAPDLANASDAQMANVGTDAFPVGQIAWNATSQEWGIDVTDFVRKHPDQDVSFVLIRENRFDADPNNLRPGDTDTSRVTINTRESLTGKPHLSLYTLPNLTYFWNTNFDANWSPGTSWDAGTPAGVGAVAVLGDFITSPHTVTLDSSNTVGGLNFQSLNSYTVAGSTTLTINGGASGPSAINVYQGSHTLSIPIALATATTISTDAGTSLAMTGAFSGTVPLTKTGPGTLILSGASPSFSGATTLNSGLIRVTSVDANNISGLGTGPLTVNSATLQLEGIALGASGHPGPDLILNNGATINTVGNSSFSKSGSPMVANGTSISPVNVTFSTTAANESLTIATAMRNVSSAASFATVNVAGPGNIILTSGGLASSTTYSGNWNVTGGTLQLGPNVGGGEAMNALGFKNADAKQPVTVTLSPSATLAAAVNAPQSANVSTTPNFFRFNVTMAGGYLGATGVDGNYGGNFTSLLGTTSRVLVYDVNNPSLLANVNLVAGAAGSLNNASSLSWNGSVVVDAGFLVTGGAFSINRTGGTVAVTNGATLQINTGATVNLGGTADALNSGANQVNIINTAGGKFHVTAGAKNVGTITGGGKTIVDSNASLTAKNLTQSPLVTIDGRLNIRANGGNTGVSYLGALSIGASGALDLNDNDLVVTGGDFATLQSLVFTGYRSGPDTTATGIVSTTSQNTGGTTILALFDNALAGFSQWPTGSGNFIATASIVGKYTYIGDTNMDGQVTPQDYTATDSNLGTTVDPSISWFYGDTNFDGNIDPTDYAGIDGALSLGQGNPLAASGLASVPEPSLLSATTLALAILSTRRRRK